MSPERGCGKSTIDCYSVDQREHSLCKNSIIMRVWSLHANSIEPGRKTVHMYGLVWPYTGNKILPHLVIEVY